MILSLFSKDIISQSKKAYLLQNRQDIRQSLVKIDTNFSIIGFGAYHGSQKTENAEISLILGILREVSINYYLPETDFSTAHFFNKYLDSGDETLLHSLIYAYGSTVPQEKSYETIKKWQALRNIYLIMPRQSRFKILGVDLVANYHFAIEHILEIIDDQELNREHPRLDLLPQILALDTCNYSTSGNTWLKTQMKELVRWFRSEETINSFEFDHILNNIEYTFSTSYRDSVMLLNYQALDRRFSLDTARLFTRMGFSHLEKSAEYTPSFFSLLLDNNEYTREKMITVMGYLTKSEVLWNVRYNGKKYLSHTTLGGFGIGDYWKEYFKGIRKLKNTKLSDLTLFKLNQPNSPYRTSGPDLIQIKMPFSKSNKAEVKRRSTVDFIDYALLISHSEANTPLNTIRRP